jgi:hypothetical protein
VFNTIIGSRMNLNIKFINFNLDCWKLKCLYTDFQRYFRDLCSWFPTCWGWNKRNWFETQITRYKNGKRSSNYEVCITFYHTLETFFLFFCSDHYLFTCFSFLWIRVHFLCTRELHCFFQRVIDSLLKVILK